MIKEENAMCESSLSSHLRPSSKLQKIRGETSMESNSSTPHSPIARSAGIIAGLLVGVFTFISTAIPAEAADRFTCRASALRINLPLGVVVEPVVANPPDDPCASDFHRVVGFSHVLGISTGTLVARTDGAPQPVFARAKVERVALANVLALVNLRAKVIRAGAHVVTNAKGNCRLTSDSSLETVVVQGQTFSTLDTPLDINIKLLNVVVAKLHLNATLGGPHPTIGPPDPTKITQRAVWLHVTDPLLLGTLSDVIIAEATVDTVGNPCS
jgi:hypothetical protein